MVDPVHCGLPAPGYSGQCGRLVLCQVSLWPTGTLPGIIVAGTLPVILVAGTLPGIIVAGTLPGIIVAGTLPGIIVQ